MLLFIIHDVLETPAILAQGLLISFLPAIFLLRMGDPGFASTASGDADFGVVGIIPGYVASLFN